MAGEGHATTPFPERPTAESKTERYAWSEHRQRPVAVDTPPPPQRTATQTHYVPYETDEFALAHQWASEQVARKYPGSVEVLSALDSLIKQQMNAS